MYLFILPFSILSLPKRAQLCNAYNSCVFGLPLLLYSINSKHKGFRGHVACWTGLRLIYSVHGLDRTHYNLIPSCAKRRLESRTANKIQFIYFKKWNCAHSFPISTFMYMWEKLLYKRRITSVPVHNIRLHNSYIYKNPPGMVEMSVPYTFIFRQLRDAQNCRQYHCKHSESFLSKALTSALKGIVFDIVNYSMVGLCLDDRVPQLSSIVIYIDNYSMAGALYRISSDPVFFVFILIFSDEHQGSVSSENLLDFTVL